MTDREFDVYALDYDGALNRGLALTGEPKEYFARERVRWTAGRLAELHAAATRILDYGCGTGGTGVELANQFGADVVVGVEASRKMLEVARAAHSDRRLRFVTTAAAEAAGPFDLAYCNGVFHHVALERRLDELAIIRRALKPGGLFAFWENNPWNPATRLVMRRIPFDRDAKLLSPVRARTLLEAAGFDVLRTDFLFLFPRQLAPLRPLEAMLTWMPAGAQYLALCRNAE
jgi:SAM-dependent methyltransferase